ncbi:hypothetical protein LCGC14_1663630, partial [marine sediment metagenome]
MSYDLDWLKNEKSEKIDIQEEKNQIKIQDKKIAPEPEKK